MAVLQFKTVRKRRQFCKECKKRLTKRKTTLGGQYICPKCGTYNDPPNNKTKTPKFISRDEYREKLRKVGKPSIVKAFLEGDWEIK